MSAGAIPVFVGPTLPALHTAAPPGLRALPPARRGDILRVLADAPPAIAIIDGIFETAASVWHKEILVALEAGVAVFGAASLGALRAAELDGLGMIGIGRIYEAYRSGALDRDDAVMVCHAPAELGYAPLTVALVDMVATIDAAAGFLTDDEARLLKSLAELLFFKERDWPALAARFAERSGDPPRAEAIAARLRARAMHAKALDACELIGALAEWRRDPFAPPALVVPRTGWLTRLEDEVSREAAPRASVPAR